jgi:hypothetical protein
MDESLREREQRAARNQLLFREVNERILAERAPLPEVAPIEVTCECVDMSCTRTVQISLHEFAEIDRATNRFLVVPGHELPDVEDVVERRDRFLIVAKRGAGADLVEGSANLRRRIELHHDSANSSARLKSRHHHSRRRQSQARGAEDKRGADLFRRMYLPILRDARSPRGASGRSMSATVESDQLDFPWRSRMTVRTG